HSVPQGIDTRNQVVLIRYGFIQVLTKCEETLHQKSRFDKVGSIVVGTEWNHFSGVAIYPMWPRSMKAIGCLQKAENFIQTFNALLSGDEPTFNTNNDGHDTKARTSTGYQITGRISFTSHAAGWVCKVVEVFKGLLLYQSEQFFITNDWELGCGINFGVEVFAELIIKSFSLRSLKLMRNPKEIAR